MPTPFSRLDGKVAIVTGGSRGIGRECCLALARLGCRVAVVAKTVTPHPTLPGTIGSVAEECIAAGAEAIPVQCDLRDVGAITACVRQVVDYWGGVDILINNASALWWQDIVDTPDRKYDLITQINARGTFTMTKLCVASMDKRGWGRVINMSPPIKTNPEAYAGATAYNISKYGMTMVALGVAAEFAGRGITGNAMWPATVIESLASVNFKLGERKFWRKATCIADATMAIVCADDSFSGNMCIDDEVLEKLNGYTAADMVQYRCVPEEPDPPRLLASGGSIWAKPIAPRVSAMGVKRGDVRDLDADMDKPQDAAFKAKL